MNTPSSDSQAWLEHSEWLRRLQSRGPAGTARPATRRVAADPEAENARRGEWTATPPGRLGKPLLADVAAYLEFFAIARAD